MKRSRSSQDVNGNKAGDASSPKKVKTEIRDDISSLMRKATHLPNSKAAVSYERAGNLAEGLSEVVFARNTFLELSDAFTVLAWKETMKNTKLDYYKKALASSGKAVSRCRSLVPGPTARKVQSSVFKLIEEVGDFVKTIECGKTRNICLEQAIRAMEMVGEHWLELVCLAKARLSQAEMLNDASVVAISDKMFKEGIYLLSKMYRPMELTSEFIVKLGKENGDVAVVKEIEADLVIIRTEYRTHTAMVQALQALSSAGELVEDALGGREEMSVDLVWQALDMLKQAALISGDVEVEANARGKMGLIYLNILKMEDIAKTYIADAMNLTKAMSMENAVNLYTFSWYAEVANAWKVLQDKVVRREEDLWAKEKEPLLQDKVVKRSLKLLESTDIDDVQEFAEFLFDFFEPEHLKDKVTFEVFKKEAEAKGFFDNKKKMLLKLITHWHPDKVGKDSEEDKKWFIVCEEITKKLTAEYSLFMC